MGEAKRRKEQTKAAPAQAKPGLGYIDGSKQLPPANTIHFVSPRLDCCAQKSIIEYGNLFASRGWGLSIIEEPNIAQLWEFAPSFACLFRTGYLFADNAHINKTIEIIRTLLGIGTYITYYADDYIFWMNNGIPFSIAQNCHSIIVATPPIKDALKINGCTKPITIIPTTINLSEVDSVPKHEFNDDKKRILMASGGRIGVSQLNQIVAHMDKNPDRYKDVEVVCLSGGVATIRAGINKYRNISKRYMEWMPLDKYYSIVKAAYIQINPAHPDDVAYFVPEPHRQLWLDSKSPIKYITAGACHTPMIASPTYSYRTAIAHGKTGLIAEDTEDFIRHIDALLESPTMHDELAEAAREDAQMNWRVENRVDSYLSALLGKHIGLDFSFLEGLRCEPIPTDWVEVRIV